MNFNITFGYKKNHLLYNNLSIEIPDNKITTICGHNGAGKTTLLKVLAGVYSSKTEIVDSWFVPSEGGLIYHFSLQEHLKLFLNKEQIVNNSLLNQAIELFGAKDFYTKKISKLSTGQKIISAIIIAITSNKNFIILDEPFASLDPINAQKLSIFLKKIASEGKTILLTSHDLYMTSETAEHIILLKDGQIVFQEDSSNISSLEFLQDKYKELC